MNWKIPAVFLMTCALGCSPSSFRKAHEQQQEIACVEEHQKATARSEQAADDARRAQMARQAMLIERCKDPVRHYEADCLALPVTLGKSRLQPGSRDQFDPSKRRDLRRATLVKPSSCTGKYAWYGTHPGIVWDETAVPDSARVPASHPGMPGATVLSPPDSCAVWFMADSRVTQRMPAQCQVAYSYNRYSKQCLDDACRRLDPICADEDRWPTR